MNEEVDAAFLGRPNRLSGLEKGLRQLAILADIRALERDDKELPSRLCAPRHILLAINVLRLALEAEEDNRAQCGTARIALEHLEDMATELNTKWHEDYASLRELS
jgi:hypothetical protein